MPQKHKDKTKKNIRKAIIGLLFVCVLFSYNIIGIKDVKAQIGHIITYDEFVQTAIDKVQITEQKSWIKKFIEDLKNFNWIKVGASAFNSAIRNSLNKIAYDTATYLGSSGKGQKPKFITEGWGEYLKNIGDRAAGDFIEELGRSNNFNLCYPDVSLKVQIGLGLVAQYRPKAPACTFSKMLKNWDTAVKDPNFLNNFQDMFNPWSNDLGIYLSTQTGLLENKNLLEELAKYTRIETKGWNEFDGINNKRQTVPGEAEKRLDQVYALQQGSYAVWAGDAFVSALGVFVNQLAITAFNNLMSSIGKNTDTTTHPYDWSSLSLYNAGPSRGGVTASKEKFRTLLEPNFKMRGDYSVLSELTTCSNPDKAGPTNCVINDSFSTAITEKMTVGQAMKQGYLNPNGIFGFISADGLEPRYNEGYPYRSMLILRKFRIIPVGWEVAAELVKDSGQTGVNLEYMVNCFDPNDNNYKGPSDGPIGNWCRGLVDPSWVLKAPQNFCAKEGYGPEKISEIIIGKEKDSILKISRDNKYCADEQSCIKEDSNGACQLFGYCTAERRKWDFSSASCEPKYNTCQTFQAPEGGSVSYLENTLDYTNCNSNNVGCQWYCDIYDYANSQWTCSDTTIGDKIYFNKSVAACDASSEGCAEFIRTKAGTGANMLVNSSWEDDLNKWSTGGIGTAVIDTVASYYGVKSLKIDNAPILPNDYTYTRQVIDGILPDEFFTVSYYVKSNMINGTNNGGQDGAWLAVFMQATDGSAVPDYSGNNWVDSSVLSSPYDNGGVWKRIEFSFITRLGTARLMIEPRVQGQVGTAYFDGLKVEKTLFTDKSATAYSDYRGDGLIYQKFLPDYLKASCYVADGIDYNYSATAPAECYNYTHLCIQSDVGCELYTSVTDGMSLPAQVTSSDYCPAECVGYDSYIKQETDYYSLVPNYFIPATVKQCNASSEGCAEFTNLDKVGQGAEAREYYTYLRQCIKPSDPASICSEFYTWEGDDETGYQLKVVILQVDDDNLGGHGAVLRDPFYIVDDSSACDAVIYKLPVSDPQYNSDCREFYNTQGEISYHLYKNTVSCSDDCHPYRITDLNEVTDLNGVDINLADCQNLSIYPGVWSDINYNAGIAGRAACVLCKNNGRWDPAYNSCVYSGTDKESQKCGSGQAGCFEYTGNTGSNMKVILADDFESGNTDGWTQLGATVISNSNTSIRAGGHSLEVIAVGLADLQKIVGESVTEGKSYVLEFIAKPMAGSVNLNFSFIDGKGGIANFSPVVINGNNWLPYRVSMPKLDHKSTSTEVLLINGNGDFYIDDIKLTEITDRYFFIKDTWTTPASCDQDIYGNPWPYYALGCDEYKDRNNNTHYLRRFSKLCSDSAIGCETMIDTHNYSGYASSIWQDTNGDGICDPVAEPSCVSVPADNAIYATFDSKKNCAESAKGCQALGLPNKYEAEIAYDTNYLINNPDSYNSILCQDNEVGCQEWPADSGISYFKDPVEMACEWRQQKASSVYAWYKKKVKRCDTDGDSIGDGVYCVKDSHCPAGETCQTEDNDIKCPVNDLTIGDVKTIGYGGNSQLIEQPDIDITTGLNWAGLCPTGQSGCSELIDPVSNFANNLIFNADFLDIDGDGVNTDGWIAGPPDAFYQQINLEPYTLYIIAANNNNTAVIRSNGFDFLELADNNTWLALQQTVLQQTVLQQTVTAAAGLNQRASKMFYTLAGAGASSITFGVSAVGGGVELKKVIIDYQLENDLDQTTCNGVINLDEGCVLFDKREQAGANLSPLIYDADNSLVGQGASICAAGTCDSNQLIKASPDRACGEWLTCRSMVTIKDENNRDNNICFDIGLCSSVDANGNCDNYIVSKKQDQTYSPSGPVDAGAISNYSGYAKAGTGVSLVNNYYPLAAMSQLGDFIDVSNGSFETASDSGYPIGWSWVSLISWNANLFKVIDNPYDAKETEGTGYAPDGKNFLKLGSDFSATSEFIDVVADQDYYISAHINTINLSNGLAKAQVQEYDSVGAIVGALNPVLNLSLDQSNGWTFKIGRYHVSPGSYRIKIILASKPGSIGNFYFDNVSIRPVLESRSNWYTAQSCRLYPQDDSLSCDYYNDSGIKEKGWWGYCLEHDHYPGDPSACILWWPVAKVKGDGLEEGAGYNGPFPVYYTINKADNRTLYSGQQLWVHDKGDKYQCGRDANNNLTIPMVNYTVPNNFTNIEEMYIEKIDLVSPDPSFSIPNPGKGADSIPCANANWLSTNCGSRGCTVWTRYCDYKWEACRWHNAGHGTISGVLQVTFSGEFISDIKISFGDHGNTGNSLRVDVYKNKPYAAEIAQTVTPTGKNKYWSGRTYEGSTWANPCQDFYGIFRPISCMYDTDRIPFGAISPPDPAVLPNPYDWDTDPNILGNQPIYYKFPDIDSTTLQPLPTPVRMGKWQNSSDVQRIFAQSYGIWSWSSNLCVGGDFDTNNCVNDLNCQSLCQQRCTDGVNIFPSSLCLVRDDCNYYGDEKCNLGTGTCIGPYIGSCTADQDCENGYCDNTSGFCNGGLNDSKACSSDTDCMLPNITCGPQSCANSTACISDSQCSGTCSVGGASRYFLNNTISNWTPPAGMADICPLPARAPADYCAYVPIVSNIKINGKNDYFPVTISGKVNLTFNSQVDSQQLPLIMYNIDWGDNTQTVMSGVEMRDKPNANLPHSLYHLYGYWELKSKRAVDQGLNNNNVYCGLNGGPVNNFNGVGNGNPCPVGQDCCLVQPKINIKDNWDWCSGQIDSTGAMAQTPNGKNDCSIYQKFGDETAVANDGWIVVTF